MDETTETKLALARQETSGEADRRSVVTAGANPPDSDSLGDEHLTLLEKFEDSIARGQFERGLWQATVESMLDLVLVGDATGRALYMNPAYTRLVGYGLNELVAVEQHASFYRLYHPDGTLYESQDLPLQKAALTKTEVRGAQVVHLTHDGREIATIWNASPLRSGDGKVVGAVAVGRDITDQQRADEAKARLAAIVESSQDAIIGKTLQGVITSWNRGAEKLYGYSADEAMGKPITLIAPAEYSAELATIQERLARGERIEWFDTVRRRKDGTLIDVSVSVSPVLGSDGRITGAATIARDITAEKYAKSAQRFISEITSALSASLDYETTLSRVAQLAVPALADVCVVDVIEEHAVRQRATSQAGNDFRGCLNQVLARYPLDPDTRHPVWEVLRTGEPQIITLLPGQNGQSDSVEALSSLCEAGVQAYMAVPIVIRGRPAGAIALMSVTSRRSYGPHERALAAELASRAAVALDNARLYRDARGAVKARDEFLSIAAHELRTPITSLRGFVQLALRQLDKDGAIDPFQAQQALRVIDLQSRKLSSLVSQLLDATRLEAGRLSLEKRIVDIGNLVQNTVTATAAGTEHAISVKIPLQALALVDPLRIEQVVAGLLDNAVKFSPLGSLIEVEIDHPTRKTIRLTVCDHGPGVPPEDRPRMFTRFYHGQPTEQTGGMGLGLYVSREIVLLHGGSIDAEFPPGGGSKFTVTLPTGLGDQDDSAFTGQ